jgi:hypothetical protein
MVGDSSAQINAIHIASNNFQNMSGNAIHIWGNNVVIDGANTIQGNYGYGVYLTGDVASSVHGISIENNYFELNKKGFIKCITSYTPDPLMVITGLRIIGNYGTLAGSYVSTGISSVTDLTYTQAGGSTTMLRDVVFDNPAFNAVSGLYILDAHNSLNSDSVVKIPNSGNSLYTNLGYSTVYCPKSFVINGSFYANGLTYDLSTGKSENITTNKTVYFPFNVGSYQSIYGCHVYCDTDSTDYTVIVSRAYRDKNNVSSYTEQNITGGWHVSGSYAVGGYTNNYTNMVGSDDVDQYIKIAVSFTSTGTYFYLGNPSVILNM